MAEYINRYNPNRGSDWNYGGSKWRLSRSKIDLFHECPRCFYIDNKLGTKRPSFPSFNLNIAVDTLFKNEFDTYRKKQTSHPIMSEYDIEAVPYSHPDLDKWRDNFVGIEYHDKETGLVVSGAIDDVWVNKGGELIVVDYKSTSKESRIEKLGDSPWETQYVRQLGVYKWLFEQNGYKVSDTGYLVYANGIANKEAFANKLEFETTLISCSLDISWIPDTLSDIKNVLEASDFPAVGQFCEFCPYREAAGKKLLAIHNGTQK